MRHLSACLLALFWIAPVSGRAQEPVPTPADAAVSPPEAAASPGFTPGAAETGLSLSLRAKQRWFEIQPQLGATPEASERKLAELGKLRTDAGVRALPDEARALAVHGFRALDGGDVERAESRFNAALELDRGSIDARLGLAAMERHRSPYNPGFVVETVRALRGRLTGLRSMPYASARWILILGGGLLAAGVLALLALTLRFQVLVRHDLEERLKHHFDPEIAGVLGWAVLLLPLLCTFDLYWAALYWLVLVWAYLSITERVVAVAATVLCASALPSVGLATRLLHGVTDPYTAAASVYVEGVVDAPTLEALKEHVVAHPEDRDAQVLEALVFERNGQPRDAIPIYQNLLLKEKSAEVLNNLANLHYRLDEKDKAFEYWNKALETDPVSAVAHYNLSVYFFEFFEFDKKNEHFDKARDLDPQLIERWGREGKGVIDTGVRPEQVRKRLWSGGAANDPLQVALGSPPFLAAVVALILAVVWGGKRAKHGVAAACSKCGQAFCRECKPGKDQSEFCLQCVHLFQRKDGVSPQMRAEKMKALAWHQTVQRAGAAVIGLVAPGAGHIFRGRALGGFALLVLWSLFLAMFWLGSRTVVDPEMLARSAAIIPWSWGLVAAGVVWVVGNLSNLFQRG